MKTRIYRTALFSITFLLIFTGLFAEELSKKENKKYDVKPGYTLNIENKYGQVEVFNRNDSIIIIDVTIKVENFSLSRAEEILSKINIEFSRSGDEIWAKTVFADNFNNIGNGRFTIDYHVQVPSYINFNLSNKYGNSYVAKIEGKANFKIKYGNIEIDELSREKDRNKLGLGYGNAEIRKCKLMDLEIEYSSGNVEIKEAEYLNIESKYSKLKIGNVHEINLYSKYDNYQIETIDNLKSESGYTSYRIEKLNNLLDINTKYGKISIGNIPNDFEKIKIINKYGNIDLGISPSASYKLDGNAKYSNIHYPETQGLNRIKENTKMSVYGVIGNNKNTKSEVYIETQYGNVDLRD